MFVENYWYYSIRLILIYWLIFFREILIFSKVIVLCLKCQYYSQNVLFLFTWCLNLLVGGLNYVTLFPPPFIGHLRHVTQTIVNSIIYNRPNNEIKWTFVNVWKSRLFNKILNIKLICVWFYSLLHTNISDLILDLYLNFVQTTTPCWNWLVYA